MSVYVENNEVKLIISINDMYHKEQQKKGKIYTVYWLVYVYAITGIIWSTFMLHVIAKLSYSCINKILTKGGELPFFTCRPNNGEESDLSHLGDLL